MPGDTRIPVLIVTGFLGSGKTTILLNLLRQVHHRYSEVIVNEYGDVGLDHHLIRQVHETTQVLTGGCLCCQLRTDLADTLRDIANRIDSGERIDRVIVETTGLADPAPIMFTIYTDPMLQHRFYVGGIMATLDGVNATLHLTHYECVKQVVSADWVVITKADIVDHRTISDVVDRIRSMNPSAAIHTSHNGDIQCSGAFCRDFLTGDLRKSIQSVNDREFASSADHLSNETRSLTIRFFGEIHWSAFGVWLSMLLHARGEQVLRVKGLLDVGSSGPIVLSGVQHIIHPPLHLADWPDDDTTSRLVIITRGIDAGSILQSLHGFGRFIGSTATRINE